MSGMLRHILITIMLLAATQAAGQYVIDRVCVGSVRYYRIDGEPGSTYSWRITDGLGNVTPLASTADTVEVTWNVIPGNYKLSTIQHSVVTNCDGVIEIGDIQVFDLPIADAGTSATFCDLVPYTLAQSSASHYGHLLWTSSGDGSFDNDTILHPVYSPGPGDILAETVTLYLTAYGQGDTSACPPAIDSIVLNEAPDVIASAGPDDESCAGINYQITGSGASNYGSLMWTHNGTGTFVNPAVLHPVYIPGINETGWVTFTLTAYDIAPCTDSVTDQMLLNIWPVPTAILTLAGSDTLCGGDSTTLRVDLTGTAPWSLTITDGSGSLSYTNIMTTPFFVNVVPSLTCQYMITALSDLHCPGPPASLSGIVWITVHPRPGAEFTWNYGSQNNEIEFYIDSAVVNFPAVGNMILWNFGDGTFGYETNPVHLYPASGTYIATLTVTDTNGCVSQISHTITIPVVPIAFFASTSPACSGSPVCFTDLSTVPAPPFGYIVKWVWSFGDGTPDVTIHFPDDPNICHTYAQIGIYPATLTITANTGYVSHCTRNQSVIPSPVADFTHSGACEAQAVQFTDLSGQNNGGDILTWNWNFGDPLSGTDNQSALQNPVHTFTAGNTTYIVRLIITNFNNCTDTIIKPVFVRPAPPVDFIRDSACLASAVHFNAATGVTQIDSIATWSWNFGDGTPVVTSPITATHTYSLTGTYITTLTVTDIHGCSNEISHEVNVHGSPVAAFSMNTPSCAGTAVQFTDASTMAGGYVAKWEWDFGDGTTQTIILPGSPNVTHVFAGTSSSYDVRLKVWSNDSCSAEVTHTVHMIPAPLAAFQSSQISCEGMPVQFTDVTQQNGGGTIVSRIWNFGDPGSGIANTSTLQNPDHTYNTAGIYQVMLIVVNASGCADTLVQPVSVNAAPVASFTADTACLNSPTHFVSTSVANATMINSYAWTFGDGGTSNQQNPVHTFAGQGVYTVTLTIVNSNGCTDTYSHQIGVRPLPVAEFSWSAATCSGSPVEFTNLSSVPGNSGMIVRWAWDFGDGTQASIHAPASPVIQHVFAGNAASYVVRLTVVTGDSCQNYTEHVVHSIPAPVAQFSNPAEACEDQTVAFTDQSQTNGGGNIVSWNWNFGDPASGTANTSAIQNPMHIYGTAGSYPVTLIVASENGCRDTIQKNINIVTGPLAGFAADTACLTHPTTFTSQSSASVTQWHWDFGDGATSTTANPVHTYPAAGIYNVTLTVSSGESCSGTITKQVPVLPNPVATFITTSPGCAGDSVHFTDLSTVPQGYITSWTWDFGDGTTVTRTFPQSPDVKHKYNSPNTYIAKLTITTSNDCQDDQTMNVVIHASPVANFTFPNGPCDGSMVQFTNTTMVSVGSPVTQWLWNFDDPGSGISNTSALENPSHAFSTAGTFHVVLHATNIWGCSDSIVKTVTVGAAPVAGFTADVACKGSATHFTDQSTSPSGAITAWLWNFGDPASGTSNTSNQQNPVHVYTGAGTFAVTLTVITSGSCTHDTTMNVTVVPAPAALFQFTSECAGNPTQFTDLSIAPGSTVTAWFWDFGDGTGTSTAQNPVYTYAAPGTYNVKLRVTSLNNCSDSIILAVTTRPAPVAAFHHHSLYCPAGRTDFQDVSTGVGAPIASRLWIFEPGYTSTLPNPFHVFSVTDTTYLVTLISTDANGCSDTVINPVYVNPGFEFGFTYDTACFTNPTHFMSQNFTSGDSLFNVRWDFGDPASGSNNFSTENDPVHIFTRSGIFAVKLKVMNTDGCIDSIYKNVRVNALPVPDFTWTSHPDGTIDFNDNSAPGSGNIISWAWDFGDGSAPVLITAPGPGDVTHTFGTGSYNVSLTVTNTFGCKETIIRNVGLTSGVSAEFTNVDSLVCARHPVIFYDNSDPVNIITGWRWIFGDGKDTSYTQYTHKLVHEYDISGTYVVKLIISATLDGITFTDSSSRVVLVNTTPVPAFSMVEGCAGSTSSFKDNSGSAGIILAQREWNFGDPGSGMLNHSGAPDPLHTYDSAGIYNVKLILTNGFGCKDSLIKPLRVHALPIAAFSNSIACSGSPTYFNDQTLTGDTTLRIWHWNFGVPGTRQDTSLLQNPEYQYKEAGEYPVRMIVKDHYGCFDTVDTIVRVHPSPLSAFRISDNFQGMPGRIGLTNQSIGAAYYYWDFGNGITSTDENPVVTYSDDGTYLIRLISYSGEECSDTTFYQYEVLFKGLYIPNAFAPTSGNAAVSVFKPVGINLQTYNIEVFDEWGHRVWASRAIDEMGRPTESWDGKDAEGRLMPQGTYMWKASATFIDGTIWQGSDIGKGEYKTMGTVALIR